MDRNIHRVNVVHDLRRDVPRKGNVDRNIWDLPTFQPLDATFPARGTWIEIALVKMSVQCSWDVPRKGNVDRNETIRTDMGREVDVPRKGNVDRNSILASRSIWSSDVPRKGNVDRNDLAMLYYRRGD